MLANFPIKYLDNELMRPMYFAHPRIVKKKDTDENYTIIEGFGLKEISPEMGDNSEFDEKI